MKKSGIYKITNTVNGKCYVGSAVNLQKRLHNHKSDLMNSRHHSRHLQSAWIKHGPDAFTFSVLLLCDVHSLVFFEQRAFDVMRPSYNISPIAGSALGVKWTDESRASKSVFMMGRQHRLGLTHTPESKEKMRLAKIGRTLSAEHKAKIGAKSKGNQHAAGKGHTDEWRKKMSVLLKGRKLSEEHRRKISTGRTGIVFSDTQLSNMSLAGKRNWENPEFRQKWYRSRGLTVPATAALPLVAPVDVVARATHPTVPASLHPSDASSVQSASSLC